MANAEVEKKLAQYRAKKQREVRLNACKAKIKSVFSYFNANDNLEAAKVPKMQEPLINDENESGDDNKESDVESFVCEKAFHTPLTFLDYIYYLLWFILWTILFAIFIHYQFGVVYLIVSGIVGMYLNTRTGPKKKNEVSAYSVFNKNCERLDGTLTAEQLQREMLYGGLRPVCGRLRIYCNKINLAD
ncbi:SAYSvFN domain-containing protein 1 [Cylas formicarius]|uniref:SAYSvFN domain-containing protein 1 n=1 Tax=Cylas formicarius TaxID=197179 RepID=UPI00295882AD|nr:SAYSvFN domain-containing protein 1 [Cylas formicarius]